MGTVADLKAKVTSLTAKLEMNKSDTEKTQERLKETKHLLALQGSELEEKEASFTSTIEPLKNMLTGQQKKLDEDKSSLDSLKDKCMSLESENILFQKERKDALKELEEGQGVVLELKEELKNAKEDLQSFATDQFTIKATEMATQALRQQMVDVRSQYTLDQEVTHSERQARHKAEEEVSSLKSELALLAQATDYNEEVAVHV